MAISKIFLDAGHGGKDPGAVNKELGFEEAQMTLDITQELSRQAKAKGYSVRNARQSRIDTPSGVKGRDLELRAEMANVFGADCFISVHMNAAESKQAKGFEVFRQQGAGERSELLGAEVFAAVAKAFPRFTFRRGLGSDVKTANFAVLRLTKMPAILIECGFISNNDEALWFSDTGNIKKFAAAVLGGIENWSTKKP